jgi:branched-chain amino acid transport system substrate-binding protein
MSAPIRREDGPDDPLSYAPRWARGSQAAGAAAPADVVPMVAPGIANPNPAPTGSAPAGKSPPAPRVAAPPPPTSETTEAPRSALQGESANAAFPPLSRPFGGDVAIKELRRQLALDPNLVPQPPSRNRQSRSKPMSNSPERPAAIQATPHLSPRPAQDARPVRGPSLVQPTRADDEADEDRPFPLRAMRDPQPPSPGRKSLSTLRDLVLVALVSMAGAYGGITIYTRMSGTNAKPAATTQPAPAPRVLAAAEEPASPPPAAAPAAAPTTVAAAIATAAATVPPTTTAALTTPSLPPGPAVRGVTDTEIHFGIAAPFSGPAKELGRQMKQGIDTAFGVVNASGGINGRQLRLVAADDGYEPSRTLAASKQLLEKDQVFGLIGNVGTPTAMVGLPYALEQKMLFFGAFTGAGLLRRDPPDRYVFNYRASYAEETEAVVRYLVKVRRLKPEQIAVFAQKDGYGDSGFAGVTKAMRALRGGHDLPVLRLDYQRNTIDVDDAIAHLRASKTPIKAVVMVPTYRAAAKFIEKTKDLVPGLIYTSVSFVGSTALASELMLLGPRFADGVIVTQVVPAIDGYSSLILEYKSALGKYSPGETPDYVSLEGYIAGGLLAEGLKRAGPQVDTEKLVDALETMRDFDMGLGTLLSFGRTEHQGSHKVWGTQLGQNGRYQAIDLQ